MKTAKLIFFCLLFLFVWAVEESHSALIYRGGGLIYDSGLNVTWLQNPIESGQRDWDSAVAWADSLSYYDSVRNVTWTDWRLPRTNTESPLLESKGYDTTGSTSELAYMYYINLKFPVNVASDPARNTPLPVAGEGSYINLFPALATPTEGTRPYLGYWSGTEYGTSGTSAWNLHMHFGIQDRNGKTDTGLYAWALRDGDVAAVPIPGAVWLLGSGLVGLVALKKRK